MNIIGFHFSGIHHQPITRLFAEFCRTHRTNAQTMQQTDSANQTESDNSKECRSESLPLDQTRPTMASSAEQQRLWFARGIAFGQALRRLGRAIRARSTIFLGLMIVSAALYADPVQEQIIKEALANYIHALAAYCRDYSCGPTPSGVERELYEHPVMHANSPQSMHLFAYDPVRDSEQNLFRIKR